MVCVSERLDSSCVTFLSRRSRDAGQYAGFDEEQPTSEQQGKAVVIERLKRSNSYRNVVMVGDGATDLAAAPPAVSLSVLRCK